MVEVDAMESWCEGELVAATALLRRLVEANSFTTNRAGVVENARLVAEAFAGLGFEAERVRSSEERFGDHLFLTRGDGPVVALVSHLDTVFPAEEEAANDFRWRVEGERVYGPGVNDIKGGTAMLWLVLRALREFDRELFEGTRWLVALNASEEVDSEQFGGLARERMGESPRAVLVFEAAHPRGGRGSTLVVRRKGRVTARIECHGRAAHSGAAHDEGANAVVELSRVMASLASHTSHEREVTWNPATLAGGTAGVVNRVPHHAAGELEVRAFDPAKLDEARAILRALHGPGEVRAGSDGHAVRREVAFTVEDPPWPGGAATKAIFEHWRRTAAAMDWTLEPESRGGLSDANYLCSTDVPVIDGLGPIGENSHCSQRSSDGSLVPEWMDLSSFAPLAAIHAAALASWLRT